MPTAVGEIKTIMLVRSSGFPQEWAEEMQETYPATKFVIVDDNERTIHDHIEGVTALIGCPRTLFTYELL